MRVFNEGYSKARDVFLILTPKEVNVIIEALEVAVIARPRKLTFKNLLNDLSTMAEVY